MSNTATHSPTEAEQLLIRKYLDAIKTQVPVAQLIAAHSTDSTRPGAYLYFAGNDGRRISDNDCSILFRAAAAQAFTDDCLLSVFVDEEIDDGERLDLSFLKVTLANRSADC